ncbi:MAG: hypothetical protein K2Q03_03195 [Sphingobacteriaceae bacterium]|nr:hypothetical protein [Sphingobacteriaceae bacterium]
MKKLISSAICLIVFMQIAKSQDIVQNESAKTERKETTIQIDNKFQNEEDGVKKSKMLTKTYDLSKNEKVTLSNKFGSITIKTWEKDEIKVDAQLFAYAYTEAEAQELLDNIQIVTAKNEQGVSFKTNLKNDSGSWGNGRKWGRKWKREVKINFTVYMPSENPLNAAQEYGNIVIDNFDGPTSIAVEYGNFTAGNLNNANNKISLEYGKGSISNAKSAKINHSYGNGFSIGTIDNLTMDAQYTSVRIGNIKNHANIKHEYGGGLSIESVENINLDAQYTNVKIKKLVGDLVAKIEYGKMVLEEVAKKCKKININSDYTTLKLNFASDFNGEFDIYTDYTSFNYGPNILSKRTDKNQEERGFHSDKKYNGKIGNGNGCDIKINAEYGSISFQ